MVNRTKQTSHPHPPHLNEIDRSNQPNKSLQWEKYPQIPESSTLPPPRILSSPLPSQSGNTGQPGIQNRLTDETFELN